MRLLFLLFLFSIFSFTSRAQYYFQQKVDFDIQVVLDTNSKSLFASADILYHNNSPDTLRTMLFHIWPNAYADDQTALAKQLLLNGSSDFFYSKENQKGKMDSLSFSINAKNIEYSKYNSHSDIIELYLKDLLLPGDSVNIRVVFFVKIPHMFSRLGYYGNDYFITQWYPKPAVYDAKGWHPIPYLDQGEFYSEFGDYHVSITIPAEFNIGATGELQTETEIARLDSVSKLGKDEFILLKEKFALQKKSNKTLIYFAKNIHDFAWCASPDRMTRKEVATLQNGNRVNCWSFFNPKDYELWKSSAGYVKRAVEFYSDCLGAYPYPQATAFQGKLGMGGGMEYPMITVIDMDYDAASLDNVITHEVGHNWLMGIIASNERDFPWMDEAINSYYDNRYMETFYTQKDPVERIEEDVWKLTTMTNTSQPLGLHSEEYSLLNYGLIVYSKGAMLTKLLENHLGKDLFDKAMQTYYTEWSFKHPSPGEMKAVFEKVTQKDLSWFFNDIMFRNIYSDYKIKSAFFSKHTASYQLTIKNKRNLPLPIQINGYKKDSLLFSSWFDGFMDEKVIKIPINEYSRISINESVETTDLKNLNNNFFPKHLFKKCESFRLKFGYAPENKHVKDIYFFPAIGYNQYDGLMTGILLYNHILPKKFEIELAPLYAIKSNSMVGIGRMRYFINPGIGFVRNISLGIHSKTFNYIQDTSNYFNFLKISPEISIIFKTDVRKRILSELKIRQINLTEAFPTDGFSEKNKNIETNHYIDVSYNLENKRTINPFGITLQVLQHENFIKGTMEGMYSFSLHKNKSLDVRFFAGSFLWQKNQYYGNYNFRMSSWTGANDYLYDYLFIARSANQRTVSHQMVEAEGGFKVATFLGSTNQWLMAINVQTCLPGKLPLRLFADFGTYHQGGTLYGGSEKILYDAGIVFAPFRKFAKGFFEVYLPLFYSEEIKKVAELNGKKFQWEEQFRFTLRLEKLDIFEMIRKVPYTNLGFMF